MVRKPSESHQAYKERDLSVKLLQQNMNRITHAKINGRATVNLKLILDNCNVIVIIIVVV